MPDLTTRSPDNPEFARVLQPARLRDAADFSFDIAPTEQEAKALAALLEARSVRKMRFAGKLRPLDNDGWQLDGQLGATVVQTCVVTLDPVTTRVDQPVHRTWLPQTAPLPQELVLTADDDDEIEPLGERLDLGLVAIEALALALPSYPRAPGAAVPEVDDADVDEDPPEKPFAALASLRDRLGGGS
jgi:uncharacterized metal-binding protein YceD (DUF177 family)